MRSSFLLALIGTAAAQRYQTVGKGSVGPRQQTEPVYSCPPNFNLNGKTCERQTTGPVQTLCTQGTLQGDICVIETPKQTRCPIGSILQGKQCVTPNQTPANRFCPFGFVETFSGCEANEQLPLVEICEIGSREGPQCVTVDLLPYTTNQYCPPGFEEAAKGGCWRATVYDCTPLQKGKGGMAGLRGLAGKGGMTVPVTNAKVNVIKQTCERKEAAAYVTDRSCPAGFLDTGSGCMQKNYFPTTTRCSNGGPVETCFTAKNAPFQYDCPPGTQMQGQNCISQQTMPEESFCAQGYDNGFTCVQQFQPTVRCEPGLQLSGNICIGHETAPPQVTVTVTCTGKDCVNHH